MAVSLRRLLARSLSQIGGASLSAALDNLISAM